MKVYLRCEAEREQLFRDILEPHFTVDILLDEEYSIPAAGDAVLVDCARNSGDWKGQLSALRDGLDDGVRVFAVLRFEQMRSLDHLTPLDDFISDGTTGEEMRARLRRHAEAEMAAVAVGRLEIDEDRYEVSVGGMAVELTYKEFELLRFLMSRPGKVFTREMLLEQVWGYDYFGGSRTVDVHIRRIRAKIEQEGHTYIRTVRGVGYIFEHQPPD